MPDVSVAVKVLQVEETIFRYKHCRIKPTNPYFIHKKILFFVVSFHKQINSSSKLKASKIFKSKIFNMFNILCIT